VDDNYAQLFAHNEPGPRFKPSEVAAIIAEQGMKAETIANQLRANIRAGLIQTREKIGKGTKNPHSSLSLSDVVVAKVLSIFNNDFEIFDQQTLGFVVSAFYGWQDGDLTPATERFPHPAFNALQETAKGKFWAFRLDVYRDASTGHRSYRTALFDMDHRPGRRFPDNAMPRGTISLNLQPLLLPLIEAGNRKILAN